MMKKILCFVICITMAAGLFLSGCSSKEDLLDPKNPVTITIWHYYNGNQKQAFEDLVIQFNETVGREKGVIITTESQGGINDLSDKVMDSAQEKVGSDELPDIFSAYADTAYMINEMGLLTDIKQYITEEELSQYVTAYLDEGELKEGELQVFPIGKSTELFYLNETAWDEFATETGTSKEGFATWEGIAEIAQKYYQWTDDQTPQQGDGKAFFGRDAFANYIIIGSIQLGTELFYVKDGVVTYNFDEAVFKKMWDNYAVPYLKGYYGAYGRFRSDDVKTGDIIACVASTAGASYFPSEVTNADGSTYPIKSGVYALPNFEKTEPYAVQQGAGMVVAKSTVEKEYAATLFLKWFTDTNQNTEFSINSGYLPVKNASYDADSIKAALAASKDSVSPLVEMTVYEGVEMMQNTNLYTNKAFSAGLEARNLITFYMSDVLDEHKTSLQKMIDGGMSREEAFSAYINEQLFQQWYSNLKNEVLALK